MNLFSKNNHIEEGSFKELFYKYNPQIFSFISKKIKCREDVMDVTQNVFVHLWNHRNSITPTNLENIVFKTCKQEIYKYYKIMNPTTRIDLMNVNLSDLSEEDLQLKIEEDNKIQQIISNINQLPERRKNIFIMNKYEKKTQEQIGLELNISKSAVEKQITKTIAQLRKKLS